MQKSRTEWFQYSRLIRVVLSLTGLLMMATYVGAQRPPLLLTPAVKELIRSKSGEEVEERQQRLEEFLNEHKDQQGRVRQDLWLKGIADFQHMKVMTSIALAPSPTGAVPVVNVQWAQIGPQPLRIDDKHNYQGAGPDSGEVTDIAIDPRNATDQVIYIGTNDGGIWKSIDGGATWVPKTDFMPSNSMGAVALDPGNPSIVYAGTGNAFNNGFFKGIGVYQSPDGGDTWVIPPGSACSLVW